jgi:hypothetical protein
VNASPDFVLLQRFYFPTTALRLAQVWTSVDVGRSIAIDDSDGVFYLVVAAGSGAQCFSPIVGFSTGTFPDLASLRLVQGDAGLQTAIVSDGTGGSFIWTTDVTTPHDGGVVIAAASGRTGAWKRIYDGPVSGRWFGTKGDDSSDNSAAIQALINFTAFNPGVVIQLGPGIHRVYSPLVIDKSAGVHSLTFRGSTNSQRNNEGGGTVLRWMTNDVTKAVIKLWSSQCTIEDMAITCAAGAQARCAIDCTKPSGAFSFSRNSFKRLLIQSENVGSPGMQYGIVMGDKSQGDVTWPDNGECMTYEEVFCYALAQAGVFLINESGEELLHTYDRCAFDSTNYGIWTRGSSFVARDCNFSALVTAVFEKGNFGTISIHNPDCEFVQRFYAHENPAASNNRPITIIGGRHELSGMAADGIYYHFFVGGPLTMIGGLYSGDTNHNFKIKCTISGGLPWNITTIGVAFPEVTDPYSVVASDSLVTSWSRIGCSYNVAGSLAPIPDSPAGTSFVLPKYAQGSEPAGPIEGMVVWNLTTHKKRSYNGTTWVDDP